MVLGSALRASITLGKPDGKSRWDVLPTCRSVLFPRPFPPDFAVFPHVRASSMRLRQFQPLQTAHGSPSYRRPDVEWAYRPRKGLKRETVTIFFVPRPKNSILEVFSLVRRSQVSFLGSARILAEGVSRLPSTFSPPPPKPCAGPENYPKI